MTARRDAVLREMGFTPLWRLRNKPVQAGQGAPTLSDEGVEVPLATAPPPVQEHIAAPAPGLSVPDRPPLGDIPSLDWEALEERIIGCTACPLSGSRQHAVPGMGDRAARVMFVGEGPGAEEDRRGLPFVGAAGQLLDSMLAAIGLSRAQGVYIANTVKCRPPRNRTPEAGEMAACRPYLERQIELVQPSLLVALGRPAAQVLLDDDEVRINAARGKVFERAGVPVVITYHPAYLLRNLADKAKAWEDLCAIRRLLSQPE